MEEKRRRFMARGKGGVGGAVQAAVASVYSFSNPKRSIRERVGERERLNHSYGAMISGVLSGMNQPVVLWSSSRYWLATRFTSAAVTLRMASSSVR